MADCVRKMYNRDEVMQMAAIQLQLAKLRKARNMTQQELAEVVGTSFQNISKWETGVSHS